MSTPPMSSQPARPGARPPAGAVAIWRATLTAACVLLLSTVILAGDTDDDGVLPAAPGTEGSGHQETGDQGQSAGSLTILGLAANLADDVLDPQRGSVRLTAQAGQMDVDATVATDDAVFAGQGAEPVNLAFDGVTTAELQGPGQLAAPSGLDETLVAAPLAFARVAVLVLDDGSGTLEDLLSGQVPPQLVVSLGNLPALDLGLLRDKVAQHAQALGSHRVSVVMVSVDLSGQVRFAGARVAATDGPTEIAIQ